MNRRSHVETPPPRLRTRIREATVNAILDAAEEVFSDAGLHAARMGVIAGKAGVSVGTLYNHFEDREALLGGLLAARRAQLVATIDAAVRTGTGRPLRERLRLIVLAFLQHCEEHRPFVHIVLQREIGRYHQTYPQAWSKKTDTMRDICECIEREMKRGVQDGTLRPEMADLATVFLMGMLRALVIRDVILQQGRGMAAEADRLLDAFFGGLGAGKVAA